MRTFIKINKIIDKAVEYSIITSFVILILASVLQVFTRYVLNNSLSWTEELARYAFIWTTLLGATFCIKLNSDARVTIIYDIVNDKAKKIFDVAKDIVITAVSIVMIVQGLEMVTLTVQRSPALKIPMKFMYSGILICGFINIFYVVSSRIIKKYNPEITKTDEEKGKEMIL